MKKEYLNHSDIAICIEHGDQKKAISLFREKIDKDINLSSSLNGLKNILGGLNLFLYTYFILHERPHLEDLCFKNMERIYEFKERDRFEAVGIEIIKSYGRCCNYICEECSCSQKDLINNAIEYIDNNLDSKLKLDDVARYVHLSSSYFSSLFKGITGKNFASYINIKRVELAKRLIGQTNLSIDVISTRCGFSSNSHFSTTFKKYTGFSPREYRNMKG